MATVVGVRGFNPIWAEFDLTGKIFDDTYYMFVLQNTIPYIPTPVYNDPSLDVPLMNPVRFLANGTLPVDIYWNPNLVYRLEFRKNNGLVLPSQNDPLIYEVNNYVPSGSSATPITNNSFATGNEVTNPQFSLISFTSPYSLTATDPTPFEVAPGWFLELAGTGTVVMERVSLNNASTNPSNAPYALRLTLTGWTASQTFLRQRFEQNGMLWANKTVSGVFTARTNVSNQIMSSNLYDSLGNNLGPVITPQTVTGAYAEYFGHLTLPATVNTDIPPAAYIDYKILLPNNSDIFITSLQLIVQNAKDLTEPAFEQDSINRQIDHTFNYYKNPLLFKPIPSLLTAWDFPLNPAQPLASTVTMTTTPIYIWDQTIGQSVVGNINIVRNTVTGGFQATTTNALEAFYIEQYLSGNQAKEILGNTLSVNINAFRTEAGGDVTARVYLYRGSAAAVFPVLGSGNSIGGATPLDAGGIFTKNNTAAQGLNWTLIARSNQETANGKLSTVTTTDYTTLNAVQDLNFSGWEVTNKTEIGDTDKFAMVVTFQCPTTGSVVVIDSIGLMKGDVATRPAPQTFNQVLEECQYYYEKSYDNAVIPGTSGATGQSSQLLRLQNALISGVNIVFLSYSFDIEWKTIKITSPSVSIYSPVTGAAANVRGLTYSGTAASPIVAKGNADILFSNWTGLTTGPKCITYIPQNVDALITTAHGGNITNPQGFIVFQYVADARLGIV